VAKVRICSECGLQNKPDKMLCQGCGKNISRLPLVDEDAPQAEAESGGPAVMEQVPAGGRAAPSSEIHSRVASEATLSILTEDGSEIKARDGDIIGRNSVGSDYLQKFPTVSRKHIQVFWRDGAWRLKNLSDNGTWLKGEPVPQNDEREINMGDELKLSSKCRLRVM
jgi:pSer/pThr/pTyr-binding forkhead associated (FHA) protein